MEIRSKILGLILGLSSNWLIGGGFSAGTLVKTPDGYERIENLEKDDIVMSCSLEGECEEHTVEAVHTLPEKELVQIQVGWTSITVAADHLFYVPKDAPRLFYIPITALWLKAGSLKEGDYLFAANFRFAKVSKVSKLDNKQPAHDITVANNHNFYVSDAEILVHNFCMAIFTPAAPFLD